MPVSTQKDIVVELLEASETQVDKMTGRILWTINLKPNKEKAMKFEYAAKYHKGKVVNGLCRYLNFKSSLVLFS